MKRKKIEAWANLYGDGSYSLSDTEARARREAIHFKGTTRVAVHLTEADPLAPLYKRVALAAERYLKMPRPDWADLSSAVAALQKARRARR